MSEPETSRPTALTELRGDHTSRKRFLRLGGAGLAGALAMTLAACGSDEEEESAAGEVPIARDSDPDVEPFGPGDVGIANYALTLEYLETEFYERAAESGLLTGAALDLAKQFGEQERAHVEALKKLVEAAGGSPAKRPNAEFPLESQEAILALAVTVEDLGANAYLGQARYIKDAEFLAAALSIHSVEARHAAVLRDVVGEEPAPTPFAKAADAKTVLAAVKPFLAS